MFSDNFEMLLRESGLPKQSLMPHNDSLWATVSFDYLPKYGFTGLILQ